jgi:hypothetical protein
MTDMWNAVSFEPISIEWFRAEKLNSLGPGTPDSQMKATLLNSTAESLFDRTVITDLEMAEACRAALLLRWDCLDAPLVATGTESCIVESRIFPMQNTGFVESTSTRYTTNLGRWFRPWRHLQVIRNLPKNYENGAHGMHINLSIGASDVVVIPRPAPSFANK